MDPLAFLAQGLQDYRQEKDMLGAVEQGAALFEGLGTPASLELAAALRSDPQSAGAFAQMNGGFSVLYKHLSEQAILQQNQTAQADFFGSLGQGGQPGSASVGGSADPAASFSSIVKRAVDANIPIKDAIEFAKEHVAGNDPIQQLTSLIGTDADKIFTPESLLEFMKSRDQDVLEPQVAGGIEAAQADIAQATLALNKRKHNFEVQKFNTAQMGGTVAEKNATAAGMRKELAPARSSFEDVQKFAKTIYRDLDRQTAAGDLAAIISMAKLIDPKSIAREGEVAIWAETSRIPNWLIPLLQKAKDQKLEEADRENIRHVAGGLYGDHVYAYERLAGGFKDEAIRSRIAPERILSDTVVDTEFKAAMQARLAESRERTLRTAEVAPPAPRGVAGQNMSVEPPPPQGARVVGQVYQSPNGPMKWTGTGWEPQ